MKTKLVSYHNDPDLKKSMVTEMEKHRKADVMVRGEYHYEVNGNFRGCAVGCAVESLKRIGKNGMKHNDHSSLSKALGWGEWLERLHDLFFENLPEPENQKFAVDLLRAVPVGVDIEPVKWRFCAFILKENIERVIHLKISDELKKRVVDAIRQVLSVHEKAYRTGVLDWSAVSSAAESAAWSAAWSARSAVRSAESAARSAARSAESAARSAVWSAARSAESAAWSAARSAESAAVSSAAESAVWSAESAAWSAESAAWSAARSAVWSAARSAAYKRYAKELLRLLKDAK